MKREGSSRSGRAIAAIVLILAVVASVIARHATMQQRRTATAISQRSLSSMNSYALALLLGGLRGPLVMFLWPSAETQKSERNLEDFDTKIEWIRLLQAEFDTVHIFQIWNKAYNISVQMANVGNKYTTILDALDYAHKVDRERPNNVNIISAIGGIYFDKFGTSSEKAVYRRLVRTQTLPHAVATPEQRRGPGWRRTQLDPMLDANGNVLEKYLIPGDIRLSDPRRGLTYNGSELEYLPRFQPYPNGLSPFALAYNYYNRARMLQEAGKQRHAQLSELVIDSRPALSLKNWAEEELIFARRAEIAAAGREAPEDDMLLDGPTADLAADFTFKTEALPQVKAALAAYDAAVRLVPAAHTEYQQHTDRYPQNLRTYEHHRDSLTATAAIAAGDRDFLASLIETDPARKAALHASASASYNAAIDAHNRLILRYFITPEMEPSLFPPGTTRENLQNVPRDIQIAAVANIRQRLSAGEFPAQAEDVGESLRPIARAQARLEAMKTLVAGVKAAARY
ncbi:MAG: hypothetical protein NZ561_09770 [Phycisphaerae bacterium]|nr:hypothetical protein [Phycisphaerae bacterium]